MMLKTRNVSTMTCSAYIKHAHTPALNRPDVTISRTELMTNLAFSRQVRTSETATVAT